MLFPLCNSLPKILYEFNIMKKVVSRLSLLCILEPQQFGRTKDNAIEIFFIHTLNFD